MQLILEIFYYQWSEDILLGKTGVIDPLTLMLALTVQKRVPWMRITPPRTGTSICASASGDADPMISTREAKRSIDL